jgi:ABC-type lipoprotein export system ATPase subunit
MTEDRLPLLELKDVTKVIPGAMPLRIATLDASSGDRLVLKGFEPGAAETFVHLVTGAALPDDGDVRVAGRSTRDIATDTEWLASLDRFGLVTERAVLLDSLAISANLALPMTLAIESMPADIRRRVDALAAEVELADARLAEKASTLTQVETVRLHLARALAVDPMLLLLERPTARLNSDESSAFGATLKRVSESRRLGWIALTDDHAFAQAAGGVNLRLNARTGELRREGFWVRLLSRQKA